MVGGVDLDEIDITVELEGDRIRVVTGPAPVFEYVMTSIVAVGEALGYDKPMPIYCTEEFRQWVLQNEVGGVGFERALGADLWELDLAATPNDLFSPKGGMLWCNDNGKALLEASTFHCHFMKAPG